MEGSSLNLRRDGAYRELDKSAQTSRSKVRGVKGFGRLTSPNSHLILPSPITSTMPQTSLEVPSRFNYQSIFDSALLRCQPSLGIVVDEWTIEVNSRHDIMSCVI